MLTLLRSVAIAATGLALLSGSATPTAKTATQLSSITTTDRSSAVRTDENYKHLKTVVSTITAGITLNLE